MAIPVPRRARFTFGRSVMALILREMTSTYGRSPGGYVWAILEPIAGVFVFTAVLSYITRNPPLGDNFPLFFATGILTFTFYQTTSANVGNAIRYSRPLLSYPNVTFVDAIVARLLLNVLTQLMITILVLGGILIAYDLHQLIDYVAIFEAIAMTVVFGTCVGLVNCYLMSMFSLWPFIWAVVNRPLFLISGIFYLIDNLPEGPRDALMWNPLAHMISKMREGLYVEYDAIHVSQVYVYGVSLVLGALGMLLLYRFHRTLLDEGA
ncbi:ABC transporter permease [Jannaschia sp. 2305UL9-9]|uniref:ABC transporter permease n=1 Tax=Jannaschia sp. 2305UL9-9 TaxID=3121638 RepID=UPI003526CFE2